MNDAWVSKINKLISIKKKIYLIDAKNFWPFSRPEHPATEERLQAIEEQLGHKLDPEYRRFLEHANGWRGFYQTIDLFGTDELLSGSTRMDNAVEIIEAIGAPDGEIAEGHTTRFSETMPIAADVDGIEVFLLNNLNHHIYRIEGYVLDEFDDFIEFFDKMVAHEGNSVRGS